MNRTGLTDRAGTEIWYNLLYCRGGFLCYVTTVRSALRVMRVRINLSRASALACNVLWGRIAILRGCTCPLTTALACTSYAAGSYQNPINETAVIHYKEHRCIQSSTTFFRSPNGNRSAACIAFSVSPGLQPLGKRPIVYQLKIEYCWVVEETTATLKLARAEKVTMMYPI